MAAAVATTLAPAASLFASVISAMVGGACVFPLVTVTNRIQVKPNVYKRPLQTARKVISQEGGVRTLYIGLQTNLLFTVPEKAGNVFVQDLVRTQLAAFVLFGGGYDALIAGLVAGVLKGALACPKEQLQLQKQLQSHDDKTSSVAALYRALPLVLLRDVLSCGILYGMNAHLTEAVRVNPVLAGVVSGAFACYLVTPLDVAKSAVMTSAPSAGLVPTALRAGDSWADWFRGGDARVLRLAPQYGITLSLFSLLKSLLARMLA